MPYRRKRFHRRKSNASKNLKFIQNRKGARSQQLQMVSLQRQLTATKNKLRDRAQYSQWELPLEPSTLGTSIDLPNGEFYVCGLCRPAAMTGLFQSTLTGGQQPPTGIAPNIAHFKSWDIQMLFSPKNSLTALTPRVIRVYVLSLKPETAQDTLQGTGGMNTTGLNNSTAGVYTHITNSDGGLATLVKFNPAAFKIHAYREFTLANIVQETAQPLEDEDVPITNTRDALKRCRIKIKSNTKIKSPPRS